VLEDERGDDDEEDDKEMLVSCEDDEVADVAVVVVVVAVGALLEAAEAVELESAEVDAEELLVVPEEDAADVTGKEAFHELTESSRGCRVVLASHEKKPMVPQYFVNSSPNQPCTVCM